MSNRLISCAVVIALASAASASTVEFRIIERRGQTSWDPFAAQSPLNDNVLNLAVQARVAVGDSTNESIGEFRFNIVMPGEAETGGTLARARISSADGTYDTSAAQYDANAVVGRGGMAAQYTYLAGINPAFNGVINGNSDAWTQTPDQDIGLIYGSLGGNALLAVYPDPPTGDIPHPLDTAITTTYFGANGNWIDVYHFNYTVANNAVRTLQFNMIGTTARVFSQLNLTNGVWGPAWDPDPSIFTSNLTIQLVPTPSAALLAVAAPALLGRRRRD